MEFTVRDSVAALASIPRTLLLHFSCHVLITICVIYFSRLFSFVFTAHYNLLGLSFVPHTDTNVCMCVCIANMVLLFYF